MLAFLLIFLAIPVQADGDGVGIDVAQLPAFVDVDVDPELQVHLQGFGLNGTATLLASISNAEGALVWSWYDNVSLGDEDTTVVPVNLSTVPAGSQQLDLMLTGHVMVSNGTHVSSASVAIQRDRPLSVGIVGASSDRLESLNPAGIPSGADPRDGDRIAWFITVDNAGDVPWNGTIEATFGQGALSETVNQTLNLSAMSISEVVLTTTTSWNEGPLALNASLLDLQDVDPSDDALEWNSTVAPPPLPLLTLSLERQNTPESAGESWRHNASVTNTGQRAWAGYLNCTWADGSTHDSVPLSIDVAQAVNAVLDGPAKDGVLSCTADGPRVDDLSVATAVDALDLSTARFEVVAGGQPVPLDGPWDVGDEVRWSAVVRNIGSRDGSVALEVADGDERHASDEITLGPGEATELSLAHALVRSGDVVWSWALVSDNGTLATQGGTSTLLVRGSPTLSAAVDHVHVDDEHGHVVEWNLSLASSVSREVTLDVGHGVPGAWTWASSTILNLDENALAGETHLGWIDEENVAIRVTPLGWIHEGGPLLVTATVQPASASLALLLQSTTVPVDPVAGGSTALTVEVSNTGTAPSDPVTVRLVSSGEILGVAEVDAIVPGGSTLLSISVAWPEGNPVGIEAVLVHKGELTTSQVSFEVVVPDAESTLDIPWSGLALGVAGGLALLTVEAIRRRAPSSSEGSKSSTTSPSPSPAASSASTAQTEKVEVACPACDRTLRVPSDYSGAVRCPDCRERFDVEPQAPVSEAPAAQDSEKVEVVDVPDKLEIGCPACARTLRVPTSFNGRVRCPACKHEFSRAEAV
jgi:uncharacterized CHY-type Zn-finger protein